MKIEFNCTNCKSVLRLPAEHEGKKARCPVCGTIVLVTRNPSTPETNEPQAPTPPDPYDPGFQPIGRPSVDIPPPATTYSPPNMQSDYLQPGPYQSGPGGIDPQSVPNPKGFDYSRPMNEGSPSMTPAYHMAPQSQQDGFWTAGLILGIISICTCACFCYGAVFGVAISSTGLILTANSKAPNRWICFLLNGIGLGLNLLVLMVGLFAILASNF